MIGPTIDDSEGLRRAYAREDGLYDFGDSLYIAGTKSLEDVSNWPLLPSGRVHHTRRYKDTMEHLEAMQKKPKRLVGHSYGASVAQAIAEDLGLEARSYGTPAFQPFGGRGPEHTLRFKHWGDPVGSLDSGAGLIKNPTWNPHSYRGYHARSNETLS